MPDAKHAAKHATAPAPNTVAGGSPSGDAYQALRRLGGEAYQLHAAIRAADHFLASSSDDDHDTCSWLVSSAYGLADGVARELDVVARTITDKAGEPNFAHAVRLLRTRAHQLHAATRAADHFLDLESQEDRSTGSWLIAYALGLSAKLAAELDDAASALKAGSAPNAPSAVSMPATADFSGLGVSRATPLRDVAA